MEDRTKDITYLDLQIYLGEREIRTYSEEKLNLSFTDSVALNDIKLIYMKFVHLREKLGDRAKYLRNLDDIDDALESENPLKSKHIRRFHNRNEELVIQIARKGFFELRQ